MIFRESQPAEIGTCQREPRKPTTLKTIRVDTFIMVIALAAGSIGLTFFTHHVGRVNQELDLAAHSVSARVLRFSVVQIWLPETFIKLAERRNLLPPVQTHQEFQRVLEAEGQRDAWYALTVRDYLDGGRFSDVTYIRTPYTNSRDFEEYPDVLAIAVGKPANHSGIDFSSVSVSVVPEISRGRTPRAVICDALGTGLQ